MTYPRSVPMPLAVPDLAKSYPRPAAGERAAVPAHRAAGALPSLLTEGPIGAARTGGATRTVPNDPPTSA
jgi:hypothetical protein